MGRQRNWRNSWIGWFLGMHSPAAHAAGVCWCKGTKREVFPEQFSGEDLMTDMTAFYRRISKD